MFTSIQEKTQCTRPEQYLNPVTALHVHAAKAIRGANNLSNLISLPISLTDHTPFFTCTITLTTIIHLAAYSVIAYADGGNAVRERIQMEVGALKSISGIWPIAGNILQQVKAIAREIFILDPQNSNRSEPKTSHSQDEMDNFVNDEVWLHEMIDTIPDPQSETEI